MSVSDIRKKYELTELRRDQLDADPVIQFAHWLGEAIEADLLEPTAMTLATADASGRVSARMVLCKGYGPEGLAFYTNYTSRKAADIASNPQAAVVFYWDKLERQVRFEGRIEKLTAEESEAYFRSRPRGSQLGAWASPQSEPIAERGELITRAAEIEARFVDKEVPRPEHWGGYRLVPLAAEFWQGRPDRLHDRFRYERKDGTWLIRRLAP